MLIAMLAAVALMADATPAAAAAATPAPTVAAKAADPDPVICKNEAVVGSRLPKKVCMRKSDADLRRQADQDATAKIQRLGMHGPRGN
jgi:hypothetical protein